MFDNIDYSCMYYCYCVIVNTKSAWILIEPSSAGQLASVVFASIDYLIEENETLILYKSKC